ncbi:acyl transferase [Patiriisocius marinus]|uniref:Acyltransferase n=1 Tax=Patiriisocius marinus TaxID=1397112 RepID=A0A5J4IZH8_9FLAO|nr:acyl transferase [Patiriisocius marinus]GER60376.1 acyltransferase [Patiriisocius marinus]
MKLDLNKINWKTDFDSTALAVFNYQYNNVSVYKTFCDHLKRTPKTVCKVLDIPFLPIQFFKEKALISKEKISEIIFSSSGTTGAITSKHYVADLSLYEASFTTAFEQQYGAISDYCILALLPSYLEKGGSSLVYMADKLIKDSHHPQSGFFLNDLNALAEILKIQEAAGQKTLLIGVSYALLDLIEHETFNLNNTIVMETGGMKGRRKELIKQELHAKLSKGLGVQNIHSEYGMTELLSQAYSTGQGIFNCPPWMKVLTREPEDPLQLIKGKTGGINIIDLANVYSCSFIATQDLGKIASNGSFEIIGRFDNSDIRGCNLMVF